MLHLALTAYVTIFQEHLWNVFNTYFVLVKGYVQVLSSTLQSDMLVLDCGIDV